MIKNVERITSLLSRVLISLFLTWKVLSKLAIIQEMNEKEFCLKSFSMSFMLWVDIFDHYKWFQKCKKFIPVFILGITILYTHPLRPTLTHSEPLRLTLTHSELLRLTLTHSEPLSPIPVSITTNTMFVSLHIFMFLSTREIRKSCTTWVML